MIEVIASLTFNAEEPKAVETYFQVATQLMEKAGAKVTQQIQVGASVIGEQAMEIVMLVEYPSFDALEDVFKSEEYQALIPIRDKAFVKYNVCVVNKNDIVE